MPLSKHVRIARYDEVDIRYQKAFGYYANSDVKYGSDVPWS